MTCPHSRLRINPYDPIEAFCLGCFNTIYLAKPLDIPLAERPDRAGNPQAQRQEALK